MANNTKISLNSEELTNFLEYIYNNNKLLVDKNLPAQTVNVEGEAGGGKTSVILQFAKKHNMDLIRQNLAELEDVSDLVGYPCKEHEVIGKDGNKKWIVEGTIPQYINAGYKPTGEKRMTHAAPEWIQGKVDPVILLLDDYSRASEKFMQATMTLLEAQTYNNWALPKGSFIILTSNPDNGEYSVAALDMAQKTRVINVNYKFEVDVWAKWAETTGIDGRCINFLLLHPELMNGKDLNARSVTMFFNSLMSIKDFSASLPLIQQLGEACTTPEFTTMFTTFINNRLDKLVTPKDMLLHDNESYIVGEIKGCTGEGVNYRADIASILTTRLINFTVNYAENNTINQKVIDRLTRFMTGDLLTHDLKYILVRKIVNENKQKFQKLMLNADVVKMSLK
jgi:hypothetical protein